MAVPSDASTAGAASALGRLVDGISELVAAVDPSCLTPADAAHLVEIYARGERICAAGKAAMAGRACDTGAWDRAGARSPAEWLACVSGTGISDAAEELQTAERLRSQPEVAGAFSEGRISPSQAAQISKAVAKDPSAAERLVEMAETGGFKGLRKACRQVTLAAGSANDDRENARRLHQGRYCRTWVDDEGAGRLSARLAPDAYARVVACMAPFRRRVFAAARRSGTREATDAYAADALVDMAMAASGRTPQAVPCPARASDAAVGPEGGGRDGGAEGSDDAVGPPATIIAVVDVNALAAGHASPEQRCEIDGVGPVPVSTVAAMMADAFLAAVVTDGIDISRVVHLGRSPTATQRTALTVRDPQCVVPGCDVTAGLEIDHVDGWAETGTTRVDRLARLCHHHHYQKSYEGWSLKGRPGAWEWHPPPPGPFDDQVLAQQPPVGATPPAPP